MCYAACARRETDLVLTLLHLSDIHFRIPFCKTGHDPDAPYRTALMIDATERSQSLAGVNAILVGGDIAFKGNQEEYRVALDWLYNLADECGCPPNRIYVIPGNHDVDRDVIRHNPAIRNAQQAVLRAPLGRRREEEFHGQIHNDDTGRALFRPLGAYNEFAAQFDCNLYAPDRFFWRHTIPIDDSTMLQMHGLTSTVLSGARAAEGGDDQRGELYLSPFQTAMGCDYDVLNLVMCHHPPEWFSDFGCVQDALCERAEIHLLHHEHRQRVLQAQNFIRFAAGAVNPDRNEEGWQPGYNLIQLDADGESLKIEAQVLEWQVNPDRFRPREQRDGNPVLRHTLQIRRRHERRRAAVSEHAGNLWLLVADTRANQPTEAVAQEAVMPDTTTKDLVFRFWNLSSSDRRAICTSLGVLEKSDFALPEPERYSRVMKRVGERGLLGQFSDEVHRREKT